MKNMPGESCRIRAVDLQFFGGERTEPATPRRREKAREEGQVSKSQDLSAAIVILAGLLSVYLLAVTSWGRMISMFRSAMRQIGSEQMFGGGWWALPLSEWVQTFFLGWLATGLLCALAAIVVMVYQVGFKVITKPFVPKFDSFNPVSASSWARGFSRRPCCWACYISR